MDEIPVIKRRANLRDVAKAAGVSVATVSRVMNTPDVVRTQTRDRVEAVIEELGFMRSAAARAINSGRTRILGALIPTLESDIFAITINSVQNRLVNLGYSLIVATTDDDPDIEARKAQELLDVGVEGLFLTGASHSDALYALLDRAGVPAVAMSLFDPEYHLPTIGYDNGAAARQGADHLASLGHTRVCVLHGPADMNDRTRARMGAVKIAMRDQPDGPEYVFFETRLSVGGGVDAVQKTLQDHAPFDAYFCFSDVLAFGALHELHRAGRVVPRDVSVIGIHDLPSARHSFPRLTTVHLPALEMGEAAAESLAKWVSEGVRPKSIRMPTTLVKRDSTAPR